MEVVGLAYNLKHNNSVARTDEADTAKTVSIAGYVAAGVLAGAAVVGWVLYARSGRSARRAAVLPLPGGVAAAAAVDF